jgi:hypothetical protein
LKHGLHHISRQLKNTQRYIFVFFQLPIHNYVTISRQTDIVGRNLLKMANDDSKPEGSENLEAYNSVKKSLSMMPPRRGAQTRNGARLPVVDMREEGSVGWPTEQN